MTDEAILSVIAHEADGFYTLIVTVAVSFLGGSLFFLEKISPDPTLLSLSLLGSSWLCLISAIISVIKVRRLNLESGRKALEKKSEESRGLDVKSRWWSDWAVRGLALGLILMTVAGFANLITKYTNKEGTMAKNEQAGNNKPPDRIEKSIPFGSVERPTAPKPDTGTGNQSGGQSGTQPPPKK